MLDGGDGANSTRGTNPEIVDFLVIYAKKRGPMADMSVARRRVWAICLDPGGKVADVKGWSFGARAYSDREFVGLEVQDLQSGQARLAKRPRGPRHLKRYMRLACQICTHEDGDHSKTSSSDAAPMYGPKPAMRLKLL